MKKVHQSKPIIKFIIHKWNGGTPIFQLIEIIITSSLKFFWLDWIAMIILTRNKIEAKD